MKKRLACIFTATVLIMNVIACGVCAESAKTVNVASPHTNLEMKVLSVTHPQGGKINGSQTLVPLNEIYDEDISYHGLVYLSLVSSSSVTDYHEIYTPKSTGMPVHICMDLGATYDISRIVIKARSDNGTNFKDVMVRASNDPKCVTKEWESADMYTIFDWRGTAKTLEKGSELSAELEESNNEFRYIVISRECKKGSETYLSFGELEVYAEPDSAKEDFIVGTKKYAPLGESFNVSVLKYSGLCETEEDKINLIKAKYSGERFVNAQRIELDKASVNSNAGVETKIPESKEEATQYRWKFFLIDDLGTLKPIALPKETYGYCTQYFVSPAGNDENNGMSAEAPFKTVGRAIEEVRKLPESVDEDIVVNIASGIYYLDDILRFHPEDSGRNGHRIIYRGDGTPTISGGIPVSGFKKSADYSELWEVQLENETAIYDLYVNNKRAKTASTEYEIMASGEFDDAETNYTKDGLYINSGDIGLYENAEDMYLNYSSDWTFTKARVNKIEKVSGADEQYIVRMQQPYWNSYFGDGNTRNPKITDSFVLSNAFELLDSPGEFYFNKKTKILFYYPRSGEDMTTAEVVIPKLEMLVKMDGQGSEKPVANITFDGIRFAHTTNSALHMTDYYQSEQGQGLSEKIIQNARFNKYSQMGAVDMNHTKGIQFLDSDFWGLGNVGINMVEGVQNTTISGNTFADIGDSAIAFGHVTHSDAIIGDDGIGDAPADGAMLDLAQGSVVSSSTGGLYWNTMRSNFTNKGKYAFGAAKFVQADENLSIYGVDGNYIPAWQTVSDSTEKQYIKYDFLDYYTVDKIKLLFDLGAYSAEKRKNFEVLLSNDPDFEDESTYAVAVCKDEAGGTKTFNVKAKRKFRYAMIRTLSENGQLALNRVQILSSDIAPFVDTVRCKNIDITNNYFTRIGTGNGIVGSAAAISSYGYEEGINISHNEIYDLPYAAIQIGHGWDNSLTGSKNHYVGYNRIEKICQTLYDGGAIYTISDQKGFVAEKNYIDNLTATVGALYNDNGSTGVTWRDNVVNDANRTIYVGYLTDKNTFANTYGTCLETVDKYGNAAIESVKPIMYGKLSSAASAVEAEAGLEGEFADIRNRVLQMPLGFSEETEVLMRSRYSGHVLQIEQMLTENIDRILENGEFGGNVGQYSQTVKNRLEEFKKLPYKDDGVTPLETRVKHIVDIRNYLRGLSVN